MTCPKSFIHSFHRHLSVTTLCEVLHKYLQDCTTEGNSRMESIILTTRLGFILPPYSTPEVLAADIKAQEDLIPGDLGF